VGTIISALHLTHVIMDYLAAWTEVPLSTIQLPTDGTAGALGITLSTSGWLHCWINGQPKLIWLPLDLRGEMFSSSGGRVAVASRSGTLTVLMF
jgi:hypothetical protein